jgi:hypothetical protein
MHQPEWNKNKGIALLRLGGLSPVKQKVRQIVPERYGLWAFIFPYWDWWFLSGPMSKDKFPKKEVPKHLHPQPRKFWAQGTIYTRFQVPNALPIHREKHWFLGAADWYRTTDRDVYDHLDKIRARDIAQLRRLNREFWEDIPGEEQAKIRDPYARGQGGFMSVDHMEVFVPAHARIT